MKCSRNEIAALAYKAALGAGVDPGSAQDAAAATVRLCVENRDGLTILLKRLEEPEGLRQRVAAADLKTKREEADDEFEKALVACRTDEPGAGGAIEVHEESFASASRLAHRIYVPATEASRLSGAGAGTTDND